LLAGRNHACNRCGKLNISTIKVNVHPLGKLKPRIEGCKLKFKEREVDLIYCHKERDAELEQGIANIRYGTDM
jgi:hypothetical protein